MNLLRECAVPDDCLQALSALVGDGHSEEAVLAAFLYALLDRASAEASLQAVLTALSGLCGELPQAVLYEVAECVHRLVAGTPSG